MDLRYGVKLPFICKYKTLAHNFLLANTRTGNLLKQLAKDDILLKNYDTIFKEYSQEGIIEKASNTPSKSCVRYHPHQSVIRNNRETSKMRIAFDDSGEFKNEKSLNNVLDPASNCLLLLLSRIKLQFCVEFRDCLHF